MKKSKKTKKAKKRNLGQTRKVTSKKRAAKKARPAKAKRNAASRPTRRAAAKKPSASTPAQISGNLVGHVTHYFPHVQAAVVKVEKGMLQIGERLHFKGHTTDFQETLQSMQLDHAPIPSAKKGAEVGIGVSQRVREGDSVFKIKAS